MLFKYVNGIDITKINGRLKYIWEEVNGFSNFD